MNIFSKNKYKIIQINLKIKSPFKYFISNVFFLFKNLYIPYTSHSLEINKYYSLPYIEIWNGKVLEVFLTLAVN